MPSEGSGKFHHGSHGRRRWSVGEAAVPFIPLILSVWLASWISPFAQGTVLAVSWTWVPAINVAFSFFLDGLGLLFALLVTVIGTLILIFTRGYLGEHPDRGRLVFWLLVLWAPCSVWSRRIT